MFDRKFKKIGFIGVGNMASAIIAEITAAGYPYDMVYLYDILSPKTADFEKKGANILSSATEIYSTCECIVLAVKPQNFPEILSELGSTKADSSRLVITIAAGITTDTIRNALSGVAVVRALPNTPILIGKGVTAICKNDAVSDDEFEFAKNIFASAGDVVTIDESEMNRIICVTSSSPAYVFKFIKAILDGAAAQGLDQNALLSSVCAVVAGSAELLAESDKTPEELIAMVCSKGGTTEQAVAELDNFAFSEGIISAMQKCTDRANELSNDKK